MQAGLPHKHLFFFCAVLMFLLFICVLSSLVFCFICCRYLEGNTKFFYIFGVSCCVLVPFGMHGMYYGQWMVGPLLQLYACTCIRCAFLSSFLDFVVGA